MPADTSASTTTMQLDSSTKELAKKIIYFTSLATLSVLIGFSTTIGKMKNSVNPTQAAKLHEEGVLLARRALLKGTAYSVSGFGVFILVGVGVHKTYNYFLKSTQGDKWTSKKTN